MNTSKRWMAFGAGILAAFMAIVIYSFKTPDTERGEVEVHDHVQQKPATVMSWTLPDQLTFAGEEVPVKEIDVREKLDREMIVNTYWHSNAMLNMKRAHRWFPVIEPILEEEGVPADFKYLPIIESGLTNAVSPAGARGFWQFMKATGKKYDMEITEEVDERYNVEKSTRAACAFLKNMHKKYGSWALAAAAYNMGPGNLNKRLAQQKVERYWDLLLNSETSRYVYRIIAVRELLENPESYGFALGEEDLYAPYETVDIQVDSSISNLADFAIEQGINYKILKTLNPWLREPRLTVKPGKVYVLKMPADKSFTID